jgi:hypothetical protein
MEKGGIRMTLPDHYSQGTTETSKKAYADTDRRNQKHDVLAWWDKQGDGATLREAADVIQWKGHQISYGSLSARFQELRADGRLRRRRFRPPLGMGEQRRNPSGRMAFIYDAVSGEAAIAIAAEEYQQQITLERGELCPSCQGRGYIRSDATEHDGLERATLDYFEFQLEQPELW